jgi:hypothetical protein
MPSTPWPLRQALALCLRSLIAAQALPAINADLAARLTSATTAGAVAFGDANLVIGTLGGVSQPTIGISVVRETITPVASDAYRDVLETTIALQVPRAGDNAPEDFELVAGIVLDNLRDLLTRNTSFNLQPTDPSGAPVLPGNSQFTNCSVTRILRNSFAVDATAIALLRSWTLWHSAETTFYQNR